MHKFNQNYEPKGSAIFRSPTPLTPSQRHTPTVIIATSYLPLMFHSTPPHPEERIEFCDSIRVSVDFHSAVPSQRFVFFQARWDSLLLLKILERREILEGKATEIQTVSTPDINALHRASLGANEKIAGYKTNALLIHVRADANTLCRRGKLALAPFHAS